MRVQSIQQKTRLLIGIPNFHLSDTESDLAIPVRGNVEPEMYMVHRFRARGQEPNRAKPQGIPSSCHSKFKLCGLSGNTMSGVRS
jgi:hypothetical protein